MSWSELANSMGRARSAGNCRPLPAIGIDHEHTVTVAVDDLVVHVGLQVADAADGRCTGHAVVGRGDPVGRGAAARDAGDTDPGRVDVRPREQVVDRADAIPALDTRGRVAKRLPPPAAQIIRAVMNTRDLAHLQRIDEQRNIAVAGEPHSMFLEGRLVAVAASAQMPAEVEDAGQFAMHIPGPVEVTGNIQSRPALEVDLLDNHGSFTIECSGHAGIEGRSPRERPEAEHLEELGLQPWPDCLPLGRRRRGLEHSACQQVRVPSQVLSRS